MKQLFWMGDPTCLDDPSIPPDAPQRLADVWAENYEEAMEAAYLLGIDPAKDRCADVSDPERIREWFIRRLLSPADLAGLDRLRNDAIAGGETASGWLERLVLEIAEIRDALDDVVVRHNRRQRGIAGAERVSHARATTPVK